MTLTIELTPELEARLREEAARLGVDPSEYVVNRLRHILSQETNSPHLPRNESELFHEINHGPSSDTWARYRDLKRKRDAETLTPQEHSELIALSDEIEAFNVRRTSALVELAKLRNTSLRQLMKQLGLNSDVV